MRTFLQFHQSGYPQVFRVVTFKSEKTVRGGELVSLHQPNDLVHRDAGCAFNGNVRHSKQAVVGLREALLVLLSGI